MECHFPPSYVIRYHVLICNIGDPYTHEFSCRDSSVTSVRIELRKASNIALKLASQP